MKKCSKCKAEKDLIDFTKDRSRRDGLFPWCKSCSKENDKKRYDANPQKKHEQSKKWKAENRERVNMLERIRNALNPARVKERRQRWKDTHPEQVRAANSNKTAKARKARWVKKHADEVRSWTRDRRAKRKGNGGNITNAEWQSVLDKYGHQCLYPGCERTDVTMDHVIPLDLGGPHSVENVQPLCKSHNSSKKNKTIDYRTF